jgi:hypothetical protein
MISKLGSAPIVDIITAEIATMRSPKEPTDHAQQLDRAVGLFRGFCQAIAALGHVRKVHTFSSDCP